MTVTAMEVTARVARCAPGQETSPVRRRLGRPTVLPPPLVGTVGYMSRVHDMGGQTGFGPVPVEDDDGRFFHADWEARVYALVRALQRHGVINQQFDELRDAIERIPPAEYLALSYYERWLRAAEMLLAEKGLLPDDEEHGERDDVAGRAGRREPMEHRDG
jgi:nitrile hydratase subunit beta